MSLRTLATWVPFLMLGATHTAPTATAVRDQSVVITSEGRALVNHRAFSGRLLTIDNAGHIVVSESLRNGWRDGMSQWFDENGRTVELRKYSRGEKTDVHRGWWGNGNPRFACEYSNGLHEGECRDWFENGMLATVQHYKHGQEDGLQQGWRRDGTMEFSYVRRDGRRYGLKGDLTCEIKPK